MRGSLFPKIVVALACLLVGSYAELFTERMIEREGFLVHSRPPVNTSHEVIFALKQQNLDILERELLERATPGNKKYLQWMTFDEVAKLVKNEPAYNAVVDWLRSNDIKITWESVRHEYIKAVAPVSVWGKLLKTDFFYFEDQHPLSRAGDDLVIRSRSYTLPEVLNGHVDTIFNTVQPLPVIDKRFRMPVGSAYRKDFRLVEGNDKEPKASRRLADDSTDDATQPVVTVQYLNEFYSVPAGTEGSSSLTLSQSVFETDGMSFAQSDLTQFQTQYSLDVQSAVSVGGHAINASECTFDNCGEGSLDIQYIMGMSQTTVSTFYYVSGDDPFVAWVVDLANDADPPRSNSMSWGAIEQNIPIGILNAFNTEAMKLGAIGVTVTISSGDNGVSNSGCNCQNNSGSSQSSWTGAGTWTGVGYFPNFPASNPYVTAIGATMGPNGLPPALGTDELVCQSQLDGVITSGGGFSTYYAQPTWQKTAVTGYFNSLTAETTPTPGYNKNGRGLPDMAMLGVWYQVVVDAVTQSVFGTSCSSPVTAGLVSLINAKRAAANMSTVGYMNPTLYSNAGSFNDVTSGYNNCCENGNFSVAATCCQSGFNAAVGWDPTTGLGSIDFPAFAAMFGV